MGKRTRRNVLWALAVLAAASTYAGIRFWWPSHVANLVFGRTTSVTLYTYPYEHIYEAGYEVMERIDDRSEVRKIVSAIRLRPKQPCDCAHFQRMVLTTPRESIEVAVCDHCLAVKGQGLNEMPPELWKILSPMFKRLEEDAAKRSELRRGSRIEDEVEDPS